MNRPRVILADDHRIVAEGLRSILSKEVDVVAVVEDGQALLEAARSLHPDVAVVDITMPGIGGIEVTARLRQEDPRIKVVILTMHREEAYARRALEVGASAYVLKVAAPSQLTLAITAALAGRTFVTPELAGALFGRPGRGSGEGGRPSGTLTKRQREILQLLADGKTAREIGELLGISTRTVESHKYELMQATGVRTSAELVRFAIRAGIITA